GWVGIKFKKETWMYSLIPYNIAMGPLSTLVTLEILKIGGTVIDVALTISFGNLSSIIGSLIWGFVSDIYDRKKQILLSFSLTGLFLSLLAFSKNVYEVELFYTILSFFNSASATPLSLLIMGTVRKDLWTSAYAKMNYLSSIGYLIGLVLSAIISFYLNILSIILIMGILTLISFLLGIFILPRPEVHFERTVFLHNLESFLLRIKQIPVIFLHLPSRHSFKIFSISRLKYSPSSYVSYLYIGMLLFYLSSGIFNTEYPAGLKTGKLNNTTILAIFSIGMLFQIISYYISPKIINKHGKAKTSYISLIMRGSSYALIGIFTFLIANKISLIVTGFVFYPIAAGIAFSMFYTSSNIMIFEIAKSGREGSTLGVYSTLTGIALTLGSFVSGYLVKSIGFELTYIIAGIILLVDSLIFKLIQGLPR
ncbi:MAG: MFS transporter, partial [Caldisphaera sp.]